MKIDEAKNIVAVKHGYDTWTELVNDIVIFSYLEMCENEAMLLHTKHHVEQALKAASEKGEAYIGYDINCEEYPYINEETIINAYPIENIK